MLLVIYNITTPGGLDPKTTQNPRAFEKPANTPSLHPMSQIFLIPMSLYTQRAIPKLQALMMEGKKKKKGKKMQHI